MDMRTTLFFTAEHELWPMVSGCRRMACGVGSGWGALHWEVDDFDLAPLGAFKKTKFLNLN